ncbi:MAG: T9SS type A sorting domain-containing protein [Ignavibacterium sp.]|nr:T9SS type A sorting domain-containing protein [Ignavibacterium sp.]
MIPKWTQILFVLLFIFYCNSFSQTSAPIYLNQSPSISSTSSSVTVSSDSQFINLNILNPTDYTNLFIIQDGIIPVGGYLGSWSIFIVDYNDDGNLDYFGNWFTNSSSTGYSKSAMSEKNKITNEYEISFYFPDTSTEFITTADINNDGKINFLISAIDSGRYYSLRCYTENEITKYPDSLLFRQFVLPGVTVKPAIGHFDGDNLTDFIIMNNSNTPDVCDLCIAFYEYDPILNELILNQTIDINNQYNEYREFAIADFDSDGALELFTGLTDGTIYGIKNITDNTYELFLIDSLDTPNLYVSRGANDIDNDDYLDLFMAGTTMAYSQVYWLNYSKDVLKVVRKLVLYGTDILSNIHLEILDINNDGNDELIFNLGFGALILGWSNANQQFEVLYYLEVLPSEWVSSIVFYDVYNNSFPDMFISVLRVEEPTQITCHYKNNIRPSTVHSSPDLLSFRLQQNYPNPFNPVTKITYALPSAATVELKVYNVLGQLITTLVNEEKPAGFYEVDFNAADLPDRQASLPSGVYMYRIQAGEYVETKKMLLLK